MNKKQYNNVIEYTLKHKQAAADNGTAAIGISEDRIVVLSANDEEQPVAQTASVMTLSENTSAYAVDGLRYYSYSYGTTVNCYNTDYRGLPILTSTQLNLLNYNKPFYESAANRYGIPWKMLAAIHYRETKLKRECPDNGDGPYQIGGKNYPEGPLTDAQFQSMTDEAASLIKQKAGGRNLNNVDNVKYTFFAYNGVSAAYKTQALNLGYTQSQANVGEGSPYVMNRADSRRDPTVEPTKSNRTWGQIKKNNEPIEYPANDNYGAYVVYNAI